MAVSCMTNKSNWSLSAVRLVAVVVAGLALGLTSCGQSSEQPEDEGISLDPADYEGEDSDDWSPAHGTDSQALGHRDPNSDN